MGAEPRKLTSLMTGSFSEAAPTMDALPGWYYPETRQAGSDFEDVAEVEAHDRRQGFDEAQARALVARLGLAEGKRLIDLGCGTGSFALQAAEAGAFVHAVDVSQAMLDHIRMSAGKRDNVAFHRAGFLTYEHSAEQADVVASCFALHQLPDFWKMVGLLRIAEMLKDGGKLLLKDVIYSFPPEDYPTVIETWIERRAMSDGSGFSRESYEVHVREEHSTFAWIIEGMLARAGFTIEDADLQGGVYATYLCSRIPDARERSGVYLS